MNDISQVGGPQRPKLLDRVREAIRTRHYSRRTEKANVEKRHPAEMGAAEVTQFLSSLAVYSRVSASTQNQALSALLFLYKEVLGSPSPGWTTSCTRRGPTGFRWCSPGKRSRR